MRRVTVTRSSAVGNCRRETARRCRRVTEYFAVIQDHSNWYHSNAWVRFPIYNLSTGRIFSRFWHIKRQRMAWHWKLGSGSLNVIANHVSCVLVGLSRNLLHGTHLYSRWCHYRKQRSSVRLLQRRCRRRWWRLGCRQRPDTRTRCAVWPRIKLALYKMYTKGFRTDPCGTSKSNSRFMDRWRLNCTRSVSNKSVRPEWPTQ